MPRRLAVLLAAVAMVGAACDGGQPQGRDNGPEPGPTSPEPPGEVIFEDDFSDAENGWLGGEERTDFAAYEDGRLHLFVEEAGVSLADTGGVFTEDGRELVAFGDVSMEVDAEVISAGGELIYGLMCRQQQFQTWYGLLVADRGPDDITAQIFKVTEQGPEALLEPPAESDAIEQGEGATNHLRADCIGDELTFFVNGEEVAQVQDDEFDTGNVGLQVVGQPLQGEDPQTAQAEVAFDNFVLREVGPAPSPS